MKNETSQITLNNNNKKGRHYLFFITTFFYEEEAATNKAMMSCCPKNTNQPTIEIERNKIEQGKEIRWILNI